MKVHVISPQNQPRHGYVVYDDHTRDAAQNRLDITIALLREAETILLAAKDGLDAELPKAIEFFREVGASAYLADAESLLAKSRSA